ncbi:hypothetical protein VTJ83DRAFT_2794 [Remersonia thermophila]|uniref:AAA+ ATPase domain-containing protein n=1 Tax=Remersonia thermophila TaxID=72144 RepID=A0ABR4DJT9_9PEZI
MNDVWETSAFTINCCHMRAFLSQALANYQDFDPDLHKWTFEPPYKPLVHRWHRLKELHATWEGPGADDLMTFLEPLLASSVSALDSTRETGMVEFTALWQLFPPEEVVVAKMWGEPVAARVLKYEEKYEAFKVVIEHLDWNGERTGWNEIEYIIPIFSGHARASSLRVCPISLVPDSDALRERLVARGRRWAELRGYHFLHYDHTTIIVDKNKKKGEWREGPVSGRVIIDAYAYYKSNNLVKSRLRALDEASSLAETEANQQCNPGKDKENEPESDSFQPEAAVASTPVAKRVEELPDLTEDQLLMASPWVIGFDLKRKSWGLFLVDKLEEIKWNNQMFENLVLPGGEKELAWEFVEGKIKSNTDFDDFVPDKGRGLIILMFGPPGVGKTYTAEAVAEKARVPLYITSAGMLGTNPATVEATLTHDLELCHLWNAMLLLDEADVFLGARMDDSLARNELVSVFLTKLEYYQGILFLTTNRFARIDHRIPVARRPLSAVPALGSARACRSVAQFPDALLLGACCPDRGDQRRYRPVGRAAAQWPRDQEPAQERPAACPTPRHARHGGKATDVGGE